MKSQSQQPANPVVHPIFDGRETRKVAWCCGGEVNLISITVHRATRNAITGIADSNRTLNCAECGRQLWPELRETANMENLLRFAAECIESNKRHLESMGSCATIGTSRVLGEISDALCSLNEKGQP